MSWRGVEGGRRAAYRGHDVVMAPQQYTYLDLYQTPDVLGEDKVQIGGPILTLRKAYSFDPLRSSTGTTGTNMQLLDGEDSEEAETYASLKKHVLGAQAQLWTEYLQTPEEVERAAFPRLLALAEVFWTDFSDVESKSFDDFHARLNTVLPWLHSEYNLTTWSPPRPDAVAAPSRSPEAVGPVFYVAQHIDADDFPEDTPGSETVHQRVTGRAYASLQSAQDAFREKVCPQFAAILVEGNPGLEGAAENNAGRIHDYWGSDSPQVQEDFAAWLARQEARRFGH